MVEDVVTTLEPHAVLELALSFFTDRSPHYGAYLEKSGDSFLTFRGRGGEEIALAVRASEGGTNVRASSPAYGQAVSRFLGTLPRVSEI
jgi:hypothetical protein